jgi:iron(III) transport system ATP-binding protein
MSLRLEGVEKSYPELTIRLDLEVRPGELLTLLGPSGCGKTTSLRLVAGFITPDRGRIWIGGRPVDREPAHRRGIGIVFQDYALFPNLNVLDNVRFGPQVQGWPAGEARRRAEELLQRVHLGGYGLRRVNTLSGGEKQRVALARALAPRPRLLLLDEPLAALDAKLRQSLRREIRALQHDLGVATLYVTHDQEEAMALSDRIAVMRAGRIEQVGTPEELYERPQNLFVAGFLGKVNLLPGKLAGRQGKYMAITTRLGTLRAPLPDALRPSATGRRWALLFRPEDCRIGGRQANRFRGRVVRREYLGSQIELEIEAEDVRLTVTVTEDAGRETDGLLPGSLLDFGVDPARCWLLPESGSRLFST